MSRYAQQLIELAHVEMGIADADIAAYCEVSRNYINMLKNGKGHASEKLEEQLERYVLEGREEGGHATRKHYEYHAPVIPVHTPRKQPVYTPQKQADVTPRHEIQSTPYTPPKTSNYTPLLQTNLFCMLCSSRENVKHLNIPGRGEYILCATCALKQHISH